MPDACTRPCAPICPISTPSLAQGDARPATDWLRDKLQRHGGLYTPVEVVTRACGATPTEGPLLDYLEAKFGEIYRL